MRADSFGELAVRQKHILVVESDPRDASLLRSALRELPFCTSFLCRSLAEARAYLSRTGVYRDVENYPDPDAVVTELKLGVDSGYELLIWIREKKSLRQLPLYLFAKTLTDSDRRLLAAVQLSGVFEKPADTIQMPGVVKTIAEHICGKT